MAKKTAKGDKMSENKQAAGTLSAGLTEYGKKLETSAREKTSNRTLEMLDTSKITNRLDWNVRGKAALLANDGPREGQTGIGTFAEEDDAKEGLKKGDPKDGMVAMLHEDGQNTPIDVYPDPKKPGHFYIADGATRFEAKKLLDENKHAVPGVPFGKIQAWIYPNMTEDDAEDRNLFSNTGRRDLRTADLAFGIARSGKRHTDTEMARMLGCEQGYVSKLHRIVKNSPEIARKWRETDIEIYYNDVLTISNLPPGERADAWTALLKKKESKAASEKDGNLWFDRAKKISAEAGQILGELDARGVIDASGLDFDASLDDVASAFGFKLRAPGKDGKEATKKQREKIAKEASDAFDLVRGKILKETEDEMNKEKAAQQGTAPDVVDGAAPN